MGRGKITNAYVLTALACVGGLLFGFDIASMSAILATPNYLVYFSNTEVTECNDRPGALCSTGPDSDLQGGITASMAGGSFLGALVSGALTDLFGRRAAIFISCCVWVIGSVITCAAQNVAMLIVGRILCGACVGIASAQVPVYLSELAPSHIRGRLVGCQQWAITWGICIFYYISYGCSFIGTRIGGEQDGRGTASFRTPWGIQMIPAIVLMCFIPFMPESPRWLASKGRWDQALEVLADVHAKGDKNSPTVLAEFKEIQTNIEEESKDGSGYLDLFRNGYAWRTHIAMFTQIWSQLTGMNVMMYYINYVFNMAGISGNTALLSSSIQYVINVVMTVPALLYLDRWGRRPTLMIGSTLMTIWLFGVAGLMANYGEYYQPNPALGDPDVVRWKVDGPASKAIIAFSFLFVASFAPTWGPVSWCLPPELFGTRLRGKAVSIATSCNWIFNFALSYFVPPAFKNIQWQSYVIFGCFTVAMTIHVFLAFPETASTTLEEVDEIFNSGIPAWRTRSLAKANKLERLAQEIAQGGEGADNLQFRSRPSDQSPSTEEKERKLEA
ncbi:putative high-affinity glucose transporter [Violaceomyces palustris]|uniref:High-affinity glucose transporter n=1 Tax=Violaceomyces palustris TaxID=1673888 RepID=A0ACD0NLZ8_9BASI|nr:putative high-affinity glucose transporter [Violaceomyces palustris]